MRKTVVAAMIFLLAGCADPPAGEQSLPLDSGVVVRDSVGIRITESGDSLWTEVSRWRVESVPLLEIGSHTGEVPGTAFGRIGPVVRLSDGRIVVGDLQALEIRVFAPDGSYAGTWSRAGGGPGELQRLEGLSVIPRDSIAVHNDSGSRYEIFGPTGSYGRTFRAEGGIGAGRAMGWLSDGSLVVGESNASRGETVGGRQVLEGEWHVYDRVGGRVALLARLPQRSVDSSGSVVPVALSYGPRAQTAATADGFWYGFPDRFELVHVTRNGVDRIIRRLWEPEVVPPALRDRYRERFRSLAFEEDLDEAMSIEVVLLARLEVELQRGAGAARLPLVFAETLPAFVGVVATPDGYVWAQEAATVGELTSVDPWRISTNRWSVFDPLGRWLGTVETPPGLQVREVGDDYILGIVRDELGVQYVRLHAVQRP